MTALQAISSDMSPVPTRILVLDLRLEMPWSRRIYSTTVLGRYRMETSYVYLEPSIPSESPKGDYTLQDHRCLVTRIALQLRLLPFRLLRLLSRTLHHRPSLRRSLREVMLQLGGITFQARDRPADVVVADRVREAIAIRDDLAVAPTVQVG